MNSIEITKSPLIVSGLFGVQLNLGLLESFWQTKCLLDEMTSILSAF